VSIILHTDFREGIMKAAIYVRVSTTDQRVESQLYDLRELAEERGIEIVQVYQDCGISGTRARRPGLDALMADARKRKFSAVLVTAFDRVARSVKHFLQTIDELESLGVVFISRREQVDTSGMMGRLFLTLIASIAELESDLIRERVRAGMRRARLEGRQIGRSRLDVNREQVVLDRRAGLSLTQVAKKHSISRASVCRLMKEASDNPPLAVAAPSMETPFRAQA
jgi:DNA invertase Pin-like site-specific DNA recombinase